MSKARSASLRVACVLFARLLGNVIWIVLFRANNHSTDSTDSL